MGQVEIGAKISVDAGNAASKVLELKESVKQLSEEFKSAKEGSNEQKESYIRLQQAQNELKNANKELQTSIGGANDAAKEGHGHFEELKNKMSTISPAAGGAAESANKFNGVLNILRANPIIAIISLLVAVIIGLISKFKEMDGAADVMSDAWKELSGIFETFINKILTPLIDGFVTVIKFITSAAEVIADKLGIASKSTSQRLGELAKASREVEDAQKDQAIALAESNRKLQEAREKAGDANLPIKERVIALKEAAKIEKEELDKTVKLNQDKAKYAMEAMALEMGARKELIDQIRLGTVESLKAARAEMLEMKNVNKEKLYELDAQIIAAEDAAAQSAKIGKKTSSQINSLEKQDAADRKSRQKEAADEAKKIREQGEKDVDDAMKKMLAEDKYDEELAERKKKRDDKEYQDMIKKMEDEQQYDIELEERKKKRETKEAKEELVKQKAIANNTKLKFAQRRAELDVIDTMLKEYRDKGLLTEDEFTKGTAENAAARTAIAQAEQQAKVDLMHSWMDAASGVADIIGKQTAVGKGISIASALISTYEGIAKGVKLGYPMAIPAVIAASATGFKAVQSIINTPVPNGGGGGGSAPSGVSASAPLIPRQAMSTTSLSGQTLASLNATASRAYVVESDIANNQQRIQRINRAARLI
ncbi:hypothetical protein UFOVP208_44 [uncultured Caudovirales phage]|uniref:Uncharacterized protein n=1 Tax=uncultured Caudovirales phage TaxID=2100421 RepID=A0A6J7WJV0_9CAUD|nr:hypothetical protein UFOVP208_44 [uncultured Caudovirales phage]